MHTVVAYLIPLLLYFWIVVIILSNIICNDLATLSSFVIRMLHER